MTENQKIEITKIVNNVFKKDIESMLKQVEMKYADVVKERATNDVHNQNFAVKQQYPEKSYLSFILKNGEFIVPFECGSEVTLTFVSGSENRVVHIDTKSKELLDITDLLKLIKDYDFCKVVSVTKTNVELFDEEALEKEEKIVRCDNEWSQTFEGFYRCSDVVGIYQNISKMEKVVPSQA